MLVSIVMVGTAFLDYLFGFVYDIKEANVCVELRLTIDNSHQSTSFMTKFDTKLRTNVDEPCLDIDIKMSTL